MFQPNIRQLDPPRDLKKRNWLSFITIPAENSIQIFHELPLSGNFLDKPALETRRRYHARGLIHNSFILGVRRNIVVDVLGPWPRSSRKLDCERIGRVESWGQNAHCRGSEPQGWGFIGALIIYSVFGTGLW